MKYEELDKRLGLEDVGDEKFKDLFQRAMFNEEYRQERAAKIKKEAITEESIDEVVGRAKYLAEKYFSDPEIKDSNYNYMVVIDAVDSLGPHLSRDLALKLLEECADFGSVEEIDKKIESKDDSLYWYNYVTQLLYYYYRNTEEFSEKEKDIILSYLEVGKTYISGRTNHIDLIVENAINDYIEQTTTIKEFLKKYE